jgi:hypothetical protein
VGLVAEHHRDRRRANVAVLLEVPARALQDPVPPRGQGGNVAIVAPVTNPTLEPSGSPNSSRSHAAATSSATAAAGEIAYRPAFWSQALVSQSAASAAGTPPPITNPK